MIFNEPLLAKVLAGEKTVTRRPVKTCGRRDPMPCRYEVGKDYAVQPGRGQKAVARILIKDVRREELGAGFKWAGPEAHREGFASWWEFVDYWTDLYGSYDPTQLVDRIEFGLVEEGEDADG